MGKNRIKYITTRGPLSLCCESLTLAYWTRESYHVSEARDKLLWALSGTFDNSRENLVDLIAAAIDDTIDVDWTSEQAAERIVDVLLDDVIPQVEGGA